MRVLLAGLSTRAAAASAARAGFDVIAIDAFGDRDQHPAVRALSIARDLGGRPTATSMARAAREVGCDAVAYLSPFENHPGAVATLASGRALLGNPPDVLRRVRDPLLLAEAFGRHGLAAPQVRVSRSNHSHVVDSPNGPTEWLVKPLRSGGGQNVRFWRPVKGRPASPPEGAYLQEFIDGTPGSVVFMSGAGRAVPIAITRQLIGDAAFGASGFRYCGSLLASAGPVGAERLAAAVTEEFGLVGLNTVDFIARDGVPYPTEVNPRWSGSMEVVEQVVEVPLFQLHTKLCMSGEPPPVFLSWRRTPRGPVVGKAIVFARHDVVVGDSQRWLDDPAVGDVPHPGERIAPGRPVCSVFGEGRDEPACRLALAARAADIYRDLDQMSRFEGQFGE